MKTIRIRDYYGKYQDIPVDDAIYEEWAELQRETDRIQKKEMYHRSGVLFDDLDQYSYTGSLDGLVDELIESEERIRLYRAITKLTPIQQRRVRMFMENMSYADIARAEGVKYDSAIDSMKLAFRHLKRLLSE